MTEWIVQGDIEKAIRLYKRLMKTEPNQYQIDEDQLNTLGYHLLNRGMLDEAIEIFKLNASSYPESGNVYDSLAEAYMNKGENKLAIQFYLKSLDKDPNNGNAHAMLNQLGYDPEK